MSDSTVMDTTGEQNFNFTFIHDSKGNIHYLAPPMGVHNFINSFPGDEFRDRKAAFERHLDEAFWSYARENGIQVKAALLPERMLNNLHERGHSDLDIQSMSAESLFDEALNYEGIIGYGPWLLNWARAVLRLENNA